MKALVTGGTGFLGQHLALRLKKNNYDVHILGRNKKIGQKLSDDHCLKFSKFDLSSGQYEKDLDNNYDYVFHCAALSSPWGKYKNFYKANVLATKNLVDYCLKIKPKRFIHISTPSVYIDKTDQLNIDENTTLPKASINYYAATKLQAEKIVHSATNKGLSAIILRPQGIFGPGDNAIFPRIIKMLQRGFYPVLGNSLIDLTYVDNVVDAIMLCMNSPINTLNNVYNISNGQPTNIAKLIENINENLNLSAKPKMINFTTAYNIASFMEFIHKYFLFFREPILTKYATIALGKSRTLSIEKARQQLGYNPKISVNQGMDIFIKYWKENHG